MRFENPGRRCVHWHGDGAAAPRWQGVGRAVNGLRHEIGRALAPAVDLIFPPRCPLCGDSIAAQSGLCAACWSELTLPEQPACAACQRPLSDRTATEAGSLCAPCLDKPPRHAGIFAGTLYDDASRRIVLAYKHGRRLALAPMMGRLIAARLGPLGPDWLIVPVPLHPWRLWQRGFNQAALLAREVQQRCGGTLVVDALLRQRRTRSLGGLGRKARRKELAGAIAINRRRADRIAGANVVLVDDVVTSGATTDACVTALKHDGARDVRIACWARVLDQL